MFLLVCRDFKNIFELESFFDCNMHYKYLLLVCGLPFHSVNGIFCCTVASLAPLSMGFSRQKYWRRLSFPLLRDLSDPEIQPALLALQADSLLLGPLGKLLLLNRSKTVT